MGNKKFLFDNAFDVRDSVSQKGAIAALVKPRYIDEDTLAAAREDAFAQGRSAGASDAFAEIEARIANGVETVSSRLETLLERQQDLLDQLGRDTARLTDAIVRKLAPAVMSTRPFAEVEALITECMTALHDEPKLIVSLPPALIGAFHEQLGAVVERNAFRGEILLREDSRLGDFDCSVEWSNGGVDRDLSRLEGMIEEAISRFINSEQPAHADSGDSGGG